LYSHGESFGLVIRNNRGEIDEIHLMRDGTAHIAIDGSIFYALGGNEVLDRRIDLTAPFPARDVLHVRLHTPQHWLKGVSPLLATHLGRLMSEAMVNHQFAYYVNQARPSFLLETDRELNETQRDELRASWNKQTTGVNQGGTPILSWGLKAKPVTTTAQDGQVAELLKLNDQAIALAFRLPLQVLGIGGTPFASTETLMQSWISSGLGFALNHIEVAFDNLFRLRGLPREYTEFSTEALLRSAFKERIDGLVSGVMGGVISSDEARAQLELPASPNGVGKECRVQQQVVPLSFGMAMKPPDPNAANKPPPSDNQPQPDAEQNKRVVSYFRNEHARHSSQHSI
jgi:HK97 family phage portal protein